MLDPSQLVYEVIRGGTGTHADYAIDGDMLDSGLSDRAFLLVLRHDVIFVGKRISIIYEDNTIRQF